jgi:polysaccharide export outer membrane protein
VVTTTTSGPVKLSPGDLIEVGVFDSPELATRARVNSNGEITFPLLGRVHVGGTTPEQTQETIEKQLAEKDFVKSPQVAVFVVEYANQGVSVLGEVNKPGVYPVMGSHQLFDFISAAGGFTARAGRLITIARPGVAQPDLVRLGHDPSFTAGNPDVQAGDTIYVGQAGLVYVAGDVGRPGGFVMDSSETLTVLQALALAGGVKPTASLASARLVRTTDQGREELPLDLKKIVAFQEKDPTLQDQDIVYVPNSAAKTGFRRVMEAALQAAVGVAIYGGRY